MILWEHFKRNAKSVKCLEGAGVVLTGSGVDKWCAAQTTCNWNGNSKHKETPKKFPVGNRDCSQVSDCRLFASSVSWHLLPKHAVKSQWIMQWCSLLKQPAFCFIHRVISYYVLFEKDFVWMQRKKHWLVVIYDSACIVVVLLLYVVQIFQRFWKQTCLECSKRYDGWIFVLIFVFWRMWYGGLIERISHCTLG